MIKEYLLEIYIYYLENIFITGEKKKKEETWNKIKHNDKLLKYVSTVKNDTFKSNIIVSRILEDKTLYNTEVYNKIVEIIYNNKKIAAKKINENSVTTFLLLTLKNEELPLTKEQKIFLIFEAENSPFTEKYYKEKLYEAKNIHGSGLNDIRYKILCNESFTLQEKMNLFYMFYPDDDIKLAILRELEWSILKELKIVTHKDTHEEIYDLEYEELSKSIVERIKLCKHIKEIIPEQVVKSYINNE